jgi:hypothetical protein
VQEAVGYHHKPAFIATIPARLRGVALETSIDSAAVVTVFSRAWWVPTSHRVLPKEVGQLKTAEKDGSMIAFYVRLVPIIFPDCIRKEFVFHEGSTSLSISRPGQVSRQLARYRG